MKEILFSAMTALYLNCLFAFNDEIIKPLNVGDKMPDVPIGRTIDSSQLNAMSFSDLEGKVIILDFWDITCAPCIREFPYMEHLQAKFQEKIQIILVSYRSKKEIDRWLALPFMKGKTLSKLPSVVDDRLLRSLFPHKELGHKVVIDTDGVVRILGGSENVYEEKIKAILDNKPITYVRNDVHYDGKSPLFLKSENQQTKVKSASVFSAFSDELGNPNGADYFQKIIDSNNQTVRSSYVNRTVLDYYNDAFIRDILAEWSNVINHGAEKVILQVKDSSLYTYNYGSNHLENKYNDKWMRSNLYCYEQIIPLSDTANLYMYMQSDINRFFGRILGVTGKIEKRRTKCLLVVRTSKKDKLSSKGGDQILYGMNDRKNVVTFRNAPIKKVLYAVTNGVFNSEKLPLIDETGFMANVDFDYSTNITNMTNLRNELKKYDLDIVEGERELRFIVISDI